MTIKLEIFAEEYTFSHDSSSEADALSPHDQGTRDLNKQAQRWLNQFSRPRLATRLKLAVTKLPSTAAPREMVLFLPVAIDLSNSRPPQMTASQLVIQPFTWEYEYRNNKPLLLGQESKHTEAVKALRDLAQDWLNQFEEAELASCDLTTSKLPGYRIVLYLTLALNTAVTEDTIKQMAGIAELPSLIER